MVHSARSRAICSSYPYGGIIESKSVARMYGWYSSPTSRDLGHWRLCSSHLRFYAISDEELNKKKSLTNICKSISPLPAPSTADIHRPKYPSLHCDQHCFLQSSVGLLDSRMARV